MGPHAAAVGDGSTDPRAHPRDARDQRPDVQLDDPRDQVERDPRAGRVPSRPMASVAVSAVGATYALIVAGKPRSIAKWVIGIILVILGFARVYLGVDHATDAVM